MAEQGQTVIQNHLAVYVRSKLNNLCGISSTVPTIQNVVGTVNLGCKLDLNQIAVQVPNSEYNPNSNTKNQKLQLWFLLPERWFAPVLKAIENHSELAARKCARIIQNLGGGGGFAAVSFNDFKVQYMVASCDVKFPIKLEALASHHGDANASISYEPEVFPGLKYRMKKPKVVLSVFKSGKIVITGAKARDEICKPLRRYALSLHSSELRSMCSDQ